MKLDDFSSEMADRSILRDGMAILGALVRSLRAGLGFQPSARGALGAGE
jgi:hypothetical protein